MTSHSSVHLTIADFMSAFTDGDGPLRCPYGGGRVGLRIVETDQIDVWLDGTREEWVDLARVIAPGYVGFALLDESRCSP